MSKDDFQLKTKKDAKERHSANKTHMFVVVSLTMIPMVFLDAYVVEQNYGSRRVGVGVLLAINEVCHLLILRYMVSGVGSEVAGNKRGWSIVAWFLFIVVFDIKLYFVHQHIWTTCLPLNPITTKVNSFNVPCDQLEEILKSTMLNETVKNCVKNWKKNVGFLKTELTNEIECDYSVLSKKLLTVFQAILLPGLYLALTGADYMADIANIRELEEIKMRMFWVAVDILDLLELQSSMWVADTYSFPFGLACVVYFYCYIALVVLPPVSLAELSKTKGKLAPHKIMFYMFASIILVNLGTTVIRGILLFYCEFSSTSTALIAKNIICLGMQITKIVQVHQVKKKEIRDNNKLKSLDKSSKLREEFLLKSGLASVMENAKLTNHEDTEVIEQYCASAHSEKPSRSFSFAEDEEYCNITGTSSAAKQKTKLLTKTSLDEHLLKLKKEASLSKCLSSSATKSDLEFSHKQKALGKFNKCQREQLKPREESGDLLLPSVTSESAQSQNVTPSCQNYSKSKSAPQPFVPFYCGFKSSTLKSDRFCAKNKTSGLQDCNYIVTPPSTFNDLNSSLSSSSSNVEENLIDYSATSLQKIMKPKPKANLSKTIVGKRNSVSLDELGEKGVSGFFQTKTDHHCQCCDKIDDFFAFRSQAESLSDLSSIALPPAIATLQRIVSSPGLALETQSNQSTTI